MYNNYPSSQGRVKLLLLFCKSSVHTDDNYACSVICCYLSHIHKPVSLTSIHAGSPTVINLTFDDQSRTLTCTSTGGPATTVTWRRDGVVITLNDTHQQTKRLVNATNGTYQTVLTINSSVSQDDIVGTYNCTVENVRGVSSETVVVPGETRTLLFHIYAIVTYIL